MFDIGQVVGGDFRIVRPLSEGGMGKVFVAEQISTGARRALKAIHRELVNEPSLRRRFEQEARLAALIPSEHVVQVIASGVDGPTQAPWLAMELLDGQTLDAAVTARGWFAPAQIVEVMTQLCHALAAAHGAGIVHRDIKPENIFLATTRRTSGPASFVKVLDFGIARVRAEARTAHTAGVGTPLWMAPEQTSTSDNIGPWTDIWPLGLIAFWMLTGAVFWRSVERADPTMSMLREILLDPIPAASARAAELGRRWSLGPAFDAWFARCVCRETNLRFLSVDEACADLARTLLAPVSAPRTGFAETAAAAPGLHTQQLPTEAPTPAPTMPLPLEHKPPTERRARRAIVAIGAVGIGIVAIGGLAVASSAHSKTAARERECAAATAPSTSQADACHALCAEQDARSGQIANTGSSPCVTAALIDARSNKSEVVVAAAESLERLCIRGEGDACVRAGLLEAFPPLEGIRPNPKKAMELARRERRQPKISGLLGIGTELSWEEDRVPRPGQPTPVREDVSALYEKGCEGGDPFSCAYETIFLWRAQKWHRARALKQTTLLALEPACDRGDIAACAQVAGLWATEGSSEHHARKACDAGDPLGCNNLASILADGRAASQALSLFAKACDHGDEAGCNNVGVLRSGRLATHRLGPRGAVVYGLRCQGEFERGCAHWGYGDAISSGIRPEPTIATQELQSACDVGFQVACRSLGALLLVGEGVERSFERARKLFEHACEAGDAGACVDVASELLVPYPDRKPDPARAYAMFDDACARGEVDACVKKLRILATGIGAPAPDPKASGRSLEDLCGGEPFACAALADAFRVGYPEWPRDLTRARELYAKSCERDAPGAGACAELAGMMARGDGGLKEADHALSILTKSCDARSFPSCRMLARAYAEGDKALGVKKDLANAARISEGACNRGDATSCGALAWIYVHGDGVTTDVKRGADLAKHACADGVPAACSTYGGLLVDGVGVTKDDDAAKQPLVFACKYEVPSACDRLKKLGVPLLPKGVR